ncbi:MAG TPA: hypothetical protein VHM20_02345 [Gammaproteobacteria bacterium]|jgi:hypothetical protein|nr:hypothetical protein [Gammaproteobacteria bacterium]
MPIQEPKYIKINGVLKKNPAYGKQHPEESKTTLAEPDKALAIISTPDDLEAATEATKGELKQPDSVLESLEMVQDKTEYLDKFKVKDGAIADGEIIDGITQYFAKYEIPIGMLNKLLELKEYNLDLLVDDSSSMNENSDTTVANATSYLKEKLKKQGRTSGPLTRWEEAEDRIHVMIDMLAYIPTNGIKIHFLNRNDKVELSQSGKTPTEFAQDAHAKIANVFAKYAYGSTPVYEKLKTAIESKEMTSHYLFTDGLPNQLDKVKELILSRKGVNASRHPLTLISCTAEENDVAWMREIEEAAEMCSEVDDFESERGEVLGDQGPCFPYSKGFWLLCQLVSAFNPNDLDALDESAPLCKMTMDNLLGYVLSKEEYEKYFSEHPGLITYLVHYNKLANEYITPKQTKELLAASPPLCKLAIEDMMGRTLDSGEYKKYFDEHPQGEKCQALYQRLANENLTAQQVKDAVDRLAPAPATAQTRTRTGTGFLSRLGLGSNKAHNDTEFKKRGPFGR